MNPGDKSYTPKELREIFRDGGAFKGVEWSRIGATADLLEELLSKVETEKSKPYSANDLREICKSDAPRALEGDRILSTANHLESLESRIAKAKGYCELASKDFPQSAGLLGEVDYILTPKK